MPFPALIEAEGKLKAAQDKLGVVFAEAGAELDMAKVKSLDGDSAAKVAAIAVLNTEMIAHAEEIKSLRVVEAAAKAATERGEAAEAAKRAGKTISGDGSDGGDGSEKKTLSFGEAFIKSSAYKARMQGSANGNYDAHLDDVEVKTLLTTTAGWGPFSPRSGTVIPFATRPIQVIDLIPATNTAYASIVYMEETTFTNNAAEIAEAGTYSDAALALTQRVSNVSKIGTSIGVTDEQLEDVDQVQGYLNNRLPFMVRQRLDTQIMGGNGTPPNLKGFLNVAGIQTGTKIGGDATPDSLYKAMVNIRLVGRAMADTVVMHPTDWMNVKLLRTADGIYIWGSPSAETPDKVWGLPVAQADSLTVGNACIFDSSFTELSTRRGMDVQITNSHSTDFLSGQQRIRADVRVALILYRPTAFYSLTGL